MEWNEGRRKRENTILNETSDSIRKKESETKAVQKLAAVRNAADSGCDYGDIQIYSHVWNSDCLPGL